MITKKVKMKNPRKSSFSALTKYLIDDQQKAERVGDIMIANCHSVDPIWAAIEVEATQSMNTRAVSDKTYHLLVSFREGEDLAPEQLKDIEAQLAKALGFEEHQRITVVHRDTDNLHMHMAINKIHPIRHTLHEPYRDHRTRDECCIKIEEQFGLEKDNHKARKTKSENATADMENMSGIESLLTHVKKLSKEIEAAKDWQSLHDLLNDKGLVLSTRGNGLVIEDPHGIAVKCSSVARHFSKCSLENKLGPFEKSKYDEEQELKIKYIPQTLDQYSSSQDLYKEYLIEKEQLTKARELVFFDISKRHKAELESLKLTAKLKRKTLMFADRGIFKSIALKHISKQLQINIQSLNSKYAAERSKEYEIFKRMSWQEWLKSRAAKGDVAALESLRRRGTQSNKKGNRISSDAIVNQPSTYLTTVGLTHVTSKGSIVYRIANTAIRDTGTAIKIANCSTLNGNEAAIRMAIKRFGKVLKIDGTAQFKTAIAKAAALKKIDVTFIDKQLSQLYKYFISNPNNEAFYHERRPTTIRRNISGIGRTNSRGSDYAASRSTQVIATASSDNRRADPRREYDNERLRESNFGKIGKFPPPPSQNNLRGLSKLGVVHISKGSEVLLQGNVLNNVVEQRPERDQQLRRDISRAGRIDNTKKQLNKNSIFRYTVKNALKSVDKFVNERNTKRIFINDISKHKAFNNSDAGNYVYDGYRKVDEQLLALLKSTNETLVIAVDQKTINRLRKARKGQHVAVADDGKITLLGSSISR